MNQQTDLGKNANQSKRLFCVDEFMRMAEAGVFARDERVELFAGEILVMSPAGNFHEVLRLYLHHVWSKRAHDDKLVAAEMQLRLNDHSQPVIDIGVLPFSLLPHKARGPDMLLVLEIADLSLAWDMGEKARAYAASGVREYWVINTRTRATTVHTKPTATGYQNKRDVSGDEIIAPVLAPELAVRLADLPAPE